MLVNFIRNLSRNTVNKMGRGRSLTGNKRGRPLKITDSVINAPSISTLGDLSQLEKGESFRTGRWVGERVLPPEQQNFSTLETESIYYDYDKRIDYNKFYTMNAPVGETEKAFKIGVKVTKRGIANGLTSSLYRRLKDQDIAQTAFVPKSATRLVTKNGKKYFQVKGWILDKIRKEKIEYWNNRFNEYYSAGLNFNDD